MSRIMVLQITMYLIYSLSFSQVHGTCFEYADEHSNKHLNEHLNEQHIVRSLLGPSYDAYEETFEYQTTPKTEVSSKTITCSNILLENGFQLDSTINLFCVGCKIFLKITDSNIPTLPPSAFTEVPTITSLYLQSLHIEKMLPGAFNSMNSLEELYLTDNNLVQVSDGVFNSLVQLKVLDLSKNNIRNLSIHSITGTMNLEVLNLSSNALKFFDNDFFVHLTKIKDLDLSYNYLSEFNFTQMTDKVKNLNLSHNRISSFGGCIAKLIKLDLGNNELHSLENFSCLDNPSKVVDFSVLPNFISTSHDLEFLSLENNSISVIPNGFFSNLISLRFLNLSSNQLEELPYGLFDNLHYLETLDISNNRLQVFKRINFHSMVNLRELYLQNNEISYLKSTDLRTCLRNLRVISLEGNNFSCENLVDIFHYFRFPGISKGKSFNTSNIYGISCYENSELDLNTSQSFDTGTNIENIFRSKLNQFFNRDFSNSLMYNFFNRDFKRSNFFKYLESLNYSGDFTKSLMYNYFNQEFKNTSFYKYLENLKVEQSYNNELNSNISNYFNKDFKNSNFAKYLDSLKQDEKSFDGDFNKSIMYNYFNKEFVQSNFYKYLETLKTRQFVERYSESGNDTKVERFVSNLGQDGNVNYSTLLVFIMLLLFVNVTLMALSFYMFYRKLINFNSVRNEQVELMDA